MTLHRQRYTSASAENRKYPETFLATAVALVSHRGERFRQKKKLFFQHAGRELLKILCPRISCVIGKKENRGDVGGVGVGVEHNNGNQDHFSFNANAAQDDACRSKVRTR